MEQYHGQRSLIHSSRGSSSMATSSIVSPLSSRCLQLGDSEHARLDGASCLSNFAEPGPLEQFLCNLKKIIVSIQTSMCKLYRISCQERDSDSASMRALESSEKHSTESFKVGRREIILQSSEMAVLAAIFNFSGTKPNYIGVQKNPPSLALCPATPNCISTAEELNDFSHYVPPWNYNPEDGRGRKKPASKQQAMSELLEVIKTTKPDNFMPQIVEKNDDYVHVEYESPILGFVDDVEFWFPPGKRPIVEYRSASRIGNYDFDINRKRIKALRLALEKKGWESVGY